jgi:hypothetical protein
VPTSTAAPPAARPKLLFTSALSVWPVIVRHQVTPTRSTLMKQFLAIFLGSKQSPKATAWNNLDEPTRNARVQQGGKAWGDWMARNQSQIAQTGGPLGKTKRVSPEGIADISNNMAAYVVVTAESHEAAAKLFENHPHFSIFPGDSVEIMECLPIPAVPR